MKATQQSEQENKMLMFPETQITIRPVGSANRREQRIVTLVSEDSEKFLAFPLQHTIGEPRQFLKSQWEKIGNRREVL